MQTVPDKCQVPLDIDSAGNGDWPYWWVCPAATGQSAADALTSATSGTKKIADGRNTVSVDAFTVWVGDRCTAGVSASPQGRAETERRLRRALEVATDIAVEREFWTGQVANRENGIEAYGNWLQKEPVTKINGGARTGIVTSLAELEQALADNGNMFGRAYIHAQPRVVTAWASQNLVDVSPDGTFLRTKLGTIVVPGVGYTGGAPGDENNTGGMVESWAYASGPIKVALGAPTGALWGADTVVRASNKREVRMERDVVIVWDPCVKVAVHVNPIDLYSGTGS